MADEVTRKDLQSLQGYCNKAIADLKKTVDANYKVLENIQSTSIESMKSYAARLAEIEKVVNAQAAVITKQAAAIEAQAASLKELQRGG